MRRALAAAAVLCLALTGCGGNDEPAATETPEETATSSTPSETAEESASPTPSEDSSPESEAIEIEIEGDKIEPNGMRVKASAGEPILLEIESDRAAELHVHSSPEQQIAVKKGESTHELTIDRPGVVDVEEHDSGLVVVQLEVR